MKSENIKNNYSLYLKRLDAQILESSFDSPGMGGTNSKKKKLWPDPLIHTEYGPVIGKRTFLKDGRIARVFNGIPYAQPPIDNLRFKKPIPPAPWKYPLTCKKYKNISVQRLLPGECFKYKCSEDCLYLNIMTPDWTPPPEGFPVMFYVHGGGFVMDSGVNYGYKTAGKKLVKHDVIYVSFCYRLGLLGYLCTNDDTAKGKLNLFN